MKFSSFFTILQWLPHYNWEQGRGDLTAGLTVGVMLIPQGMAYAMLAGLPPIYGLYAATVPLILYAIFGTSRQLSVGPVALVSLLTAAGLSPLAQAGSVSYIALATTLAFYVGLLQLLLGLCRLGFLVNFLSYPVVSGFTSASALIIGLNQLKHLLGINLPQSFHLHEVLYQAAIRLGEVHWFTFIIGCIGILVLYGIRKISKAIPGSLLVVVLSILAVWAFGLAEQGVKIVGVIPSGLPSLQLPIVDSTTIQHLLPTILSITLVSLMESISIAKAIQARHRTYKIIPNKELIALGFANLGGSLFQSYPVDGGFSRTAVNDQAGAKTGMASIISAVLVLLSLLFFTPLFYYLPQAVLASIILVAVSGLIDIKTPRHLWFANRTDFWMLITTFVATATLGIQQGVGIGVILSLAMLIFRTTRPHIAVLGRVPGTTFYRNLGRFEQLEDRPDLLIIRFDAQLYFANVAYFREKLDELVHAKGKPLKAVIISAGSINGMDSTAIRALEELFTDYRSQGLEIYLAGVKGPVRDAMVRGKLVEKIGSQNFFMGVQEAVEYMDTQEKNIAQRPLQDFTLQSNVKRQP